MIKSVHSIFYVDPMSYNNLAEYDYSLLTNINIAGILYLCSTKYDKCNIPNVAIKKIFSYHNVRNTYIKALSYSLTMFNLIKLAIKYKPKIVHFQWLKFYYIDIFVIYLLKFIGIKIAFTAHNILPHDGTNKDKIHYSKIYKAIHHIIVHSCTTKRQLIDIFDLPENKISVIYHGVLNTSSNTEDISIKENWIRENFDINGKIVFAMLGRFSKYKGAELLTDVWKNSNLLKSNKYALFLIGKDSSNYAKMCTGISNVYHIDDFVSPELLVAFQKIADCIILPYKRISQSGVLLSLITTRTPFVISNIGGLTDLLEYADVGWSFEGPTEENLRDILLSIIQNPEILREKRENTLLWQKLEKIYSWESIGANTMLVYKNI